MVDPTEPHGDGPADTGTATDARPASGTGTTMTRSEEEFARSAGSGFASAS